MHDTNYSERIKYYSSYRIAKTEHTLKSCRTKGERSIWQRLLWEHYVLNEAYYRMHVDYIHMNLVKHGYVKRVQD